MEKKKIISSYTVQFELEGVRGINTQRRNKTKQNKKKEYGSAAPKRKFTHATSANPRKLKFVFWKKKRSIFNNDNFGMGMGGN